MKITLNGEEIFPARYAHGEDLKGKAYTVMIERIEHEEMTNPHTKRNEKKFVIYFANSRRGFVLGKEFAESIARALAMNEAEKWIGQRVIIYPQQTRLGVGVRARAIGTNHAEPTPPPDDDDDDPTA